MTEPDIVAELEAWWDRRHDYQGDVLWGLVQRARDEILALRSGVYWHGWQCSRAEALEEAAQACRGALSEKARPDANDMRNACAAAIRALKDKADAPA